MNKLRKGVFETNSSSEHTLVMCNNKTIVTPEDIEIFANDPVSLEKGWVVWNEDHTGYYLSVDGESFGGLFSLITEWHAKLQYVLADYGASGMTMIVELLKEYIGPKFLGLLLKLDYCYNHKEFVAYDYLDDAFGSIDHQSSGMARNSISKINPKDEKAGIRELIFNNQYVIVTQEDCDDKLKEFVESGFMGNMGFTHVLQETYQKDPQTGKHDYRKPITTFIPLAEYFSERYNEE